MQKPPLKYQPDTTYYLFIFNIVEIDIGMYEDPVYEGRYPKISTKSVVNEGVMTSKVTK